MAASDAEALAGLLIRSSGASGGVCVVLGCNDSDLAASVGKRGAFVVHALYPEWQLVDHARKAVRARGAYGRVSANLQRSSRLPYAENLVNVLVAEDFPKLRARGLAIEEVLRVLCPLGAAFFGSGKPAGQSGAKWLQELRPALLSAGFGDVAVVGESRTWVKAAKSWPADIDEWTHNCHGPDGNPVAHDRVVGPPKRYQWVSGPLYLRAHDTDSSVNALVTARGRLFYMVDEAPISLPGQHPLPDKWFLVARDAFNGVLLWKVRIKQWGWREWKPYWFKRRPGNFPVNVHRRVVAVGDRLYATLGYHAPVSQLDAATGKTLRTYEETTETREILCHDGRLILSAQVKDRLKLMVVEAETGAVAWETKPEYGGTSTEYIYWDRRMPRVKLDPVLNAATDGRAVCFLDGKEIVCLDLEDGAERWRTAVESKSPALWVGALIVHDGVVLHAEPEQLTALSAETGQQLWAQPKRPIGWLWFQWKDVFVVRGLVWTWSAELTDKAYEQRGKKARSRWPAAVHGYDLRTGELKERVPLGHIFTAHHHHRCYRNKATERYILASRRGTEFIALDGSHLSVHNWVRGTCHLGMMPANGLQYVPPHPCACYINEKLNGFGALAPAAASAGGGGPAPEQLERGPAYGQIRDRQSGIRNPDDWPTFRHDPMRSGSTAASLPDRLAPLWRVRAGATLSAPTVVGDKLFVSAVDEHHVLALNAADGSKLWEVAAGGRVDSPPTYHKGTLLFGAADGWVYCVRDADGAPVWRFRAAPEERLMGAFSQLESAWPVHGSVLVHRDVAYFAAGRSSYLDGGIHVYGVDAATGQLLHQARLEGPDTDFSDGQAHFSYGGGPGALPDIMQADSQCVYMRNKAFDLELASRTGNPRRIQARGGFLDDTYFRRAFWLYEKPANWARLIVRDDRSFYGVRMFDTLRCLDPNNYFVPGKKGYLLFAQELGGRKPTWSQRVPIRVKAMVVAGRRLVVTGPPDVIDPENPLGAFEGRKGGLLWVFSADSGEKLAEHTLDAPPVFNGIAAARGRLYLCTRDGSVLCLGEKSR
jgi:outer membrane protein assembly factor BamB